LATDNSVSQNAAFFVVPKDSTAVFCLAISTYGGQGAPKRTPGPRTTLLYSSKDSLPQNVGFTRSLSRIIIEEPSETIDPKSMIDFGRSTLWNITSKFSTPAGFLNGIRASDQYFNPKPSARAADLDDQGYRKRWSNF